MKRSIFNLLFFISSWGMAQTDSILYTRDFEFREGIYLTLEQFRNNDPILPSAIVSSVPKTELNFLNRVLDRKKLVYKDKTGAQQEIPTANVWGFCRNKTLFINFNQTFNRVNLIGSLCHFTCEVVVLSSYQDPMYYNHGISSSYNELRQFIFCVDSNIVKDFNTPAMEEILQRDTELYAQFMKMKRKEKGNSIFTYIRKYNEKHPLYIKN